MKEVFKFFYLPKRENAEDIFFKTEKEKLILIIKLAVIGILFFEINKFFNVYMYENGIYEGIKLIVGLIFKNFIYYCLWLTVLSTILFILIKLFRWKASFLDSLLIISIPAFFSSIIVWLVILAIILAFTFNPLFIISGSIFVQIASIIWIVWSVILFIVLVNLHLDSVIKTIWFFMLLIIVSWAIYIYNLKDNKKYYLETSDSLRIMEVDSILKRLSIEFVKEWKYPEFLDESYSKDRREGETENGCYFTYLYEKISDEEIRISFCPESERWKEKAKNDGWIYDNRYEVKNYKL